MHPPVNIFPTPVIMLYAPFNSISGNYNIDPPFFKFVALSRREFESSFINNFDRFLFLHNTNPIFNF